MGVIRSRSTGQQAAGAAAVTVAAPAPAVAWSAHQLAFFDWVANAGGSAILEAVAGSGKTTTLVESVRRFKARYPAARIAVCAYNRKMGDELKLRTAGIPQVTANTLHGFGMGALSRTGRVQVEAKKVQLIVRDLMKSSPEMKPFWYAQDFIVKLVGYAKEIGVGYSVPVADTNAWLALIMKHDMTLSGGAGGDSDSAHETLMLIVELAMSVLHASLADRTTIDFADMLLHVLVHNVRMDQYDVVLVDEAQDTNPTRRALVAKMLKPGGRAVFVGDPRQAIFGFTGADNDSLEQIARDFNCVKLPLTVSYRCPQAVIKHAHQWVEHIEAAATAVEGSVSGMSYDKLLSSAQELLKPTDAILCRKTAPLVTLAFTLIRQGIACRIEGRDIATQLVNLIRRFKVAKLDTLIHRVEDHCTREMQRELAKHNEVRAEQIADRLECVLVLIDRAASLKLDVDGLVSMVYSMFGDSTAGKPPTILTLSTIHRAKGMEWETVYLLGREQFMPSHFARQEWQIQQEINLIYVAVTRAKLSLVEVHDVPQLSRKKED